MHPEAVRFQRRLVARVSVIAKSGSFRKFRFIAVKGLLPQ
jgi:hypothetical protein